MVRKLEILRREVVSIMTSHRISVLDESVAYADRYSAEHSKARP
jgi:hypothetical protein